MAAGPEYLMSDAKRPRLVSIVHNHASTSSARTNDPSSGAAETNQVQINTPVSIASGVEMYAGHQQRRRISCANPSMFVFDSES